jgi:hypothetical protein
VKHHHNHFHYCHYFLRFYKILFILLIFQGSGSIMLLAKQPLTSCRFEMAHSYMIVDLQLTFIIVSGGMAVSWTWIGMPE